MCPTCPEGVLALSRMVATPREGRLHHVSRPLRRQMRVLLDRTRWPSLVTYSDESVGHTGYVYRCSGWTPTEKNRVRTFTVDGARVSRYSNGASRAPEGGVPGWAWIQRWEHHAHADPRAVFDEHWVRVPTGKFWRSGAPAYRYERRDTTPTM